MTGNKKNKFFSLSSKNTMLIEFLDFLNNCISIILVRRMYGDF